MKKRWMQLCVIKTRCSFNLVKIPQSKNRGQLLKSRTDRGNIAAIGSICRSCLFFARAEKLEFPNLYPVAAHFDPVYEQVSALCLAEQALVLQVVQHLPSVHELMG